MKFKDLFISVVIIELLISLYFVKGNIESLYHEFSNFGFDPFELLGALSRASWMVFIIVGIVGVVLFFSNNNIYNRVLKIYLINHVIVLVLHLPSRLYWILNPDAGISMQWYYHLLFFISIGLAILGILFYSNQKVNVLPVPVKSKATRFMHYIIDSFYLNFIMLGNVSMYLSFYRYNNELDALGIINLAMFFVMPFLYYTICEAGFKQTIGKVISGSYVRSASGGNASFGSILGRSLCRYIPFEAFSFLPDPMAKWHDKFSGTDVFYKSNVALSDAGDPLMDHLVNPDDISAFDKS